MPINYTKEGKIIWHFWSTLKNTFKKEKKKKEGKIASLIYTMERVIVIVLL